MDEEPAEHVVGRAPQLDVVALHDIAELVPEGGSVCTNIDQLLHQGC